ncbi:putative cyclic nucleotide-gated ion channel 10 [Prunus yedoensis var. nudiflora]|uniref:Putative cyclic nucleotide-gated ion channel 10 n=1 Tax=Prunus yedoensis var. nudiflora TaxID=2094558 RepID=A0A314Y5P7_PRUYE|nr:putative cyclic nucleotide-gated ion channel 10 [Prunus yedoensis var. nudiflora]
MERSWNKNLYLNACLFSVDHDGNVEWESGSGYYEAGGHRSSRKWPTTKEILVPHEQPAMTFLRKWDIVFTIACVFAVFHDPLYPYIPVVDGDRMCYDVNLHLMWSFFGSRSALDLFYAMDIAIFCRWRICSKPNAKTSFKARTILKLLSRVFRALPIPQLTCKLTLGRGGGIVEEVTNRGGARGEEDDLLFSQII